MSALPALTEAIVQDVIYAYCDAAKHQITVPNCGTVFMYESDIASMTKTRFGHEFEVKVSRADWLAELRKIASSDSNSKRSRAKRLANAAAIASALKAAWANGEERCGEEFRFTQDPTPNYFWVVAPPGVVKAEELPEYAGLMEVEPYRFGNHKAHGYRLTQTKAAPRLHALKMTDRQVMAMARGVSLRYWQMRGAA